ncbi:MAG: alpha-amylase family glycosyl hydrolase [Opitutaceae bacterium]
MLPQICKEGIYFKLWAPNLETVGLRIYNGAATEEYVMQRDLEGFHQYTLKAYGHGVRYHYLINGQPIPDPASAYQPTGVHGPSMVVNFMQFDWSDDRAWRGVSRTDLVFYELHIGTFTQDGTYLSAIERLNELVELGITAVQIMPLAQCPGKWNWGYDGVQLFAPNHNYGTPEELCEFVKACHARGLAIYLDVVYNHLGPEGNYLGAFGPYFHKEATVWGDCPDMSRPEVRAYFIDNARYWIEQYHFDGIRFDAIAMIYDPSETHIMNEIGALYRVLSKKLERKVHAIGESNLYQPEFLPEHGGAMHALWSDDIGHAMEACVTPINNHGGRSYHGMQDLLEALQTGCLYRRNESNSAERRSENELKVIRERCVNQLQNHDIVGNSPSGKRIHQYASTDAQRALAALTILYPTIPMIFMGEEFAADSPFLFFTDFESPELRIAVECGRAREFPHHAWETAVSPTSPKSFLLSKLPDSDSGDYSTRAWYSALLKARRLWKSRKLLDSKHLEVTGDSDQGIYILNYNNETESRFVAVKIGHGARALNLSESFSIHGQSGNLTRRDNQLYLNTNTCLFGSGNIHLGE